MLCRLTPTHWDVFVVVVVVVAVVVVAGANELHLQYFKFVGRVFGKALLEQHTMSGHFTVPIYKHLLAYVDELFIVVVCCLSLIHI